MSLERKLHPKPVDWDEMYSGRFLKCADLKGKNVTLTIAAVDLETLEGETGPQKKGVVAFEKTDKMLALNKTNGICLKEMFGKKVQSWIGKRVTLMPAMWSGDETIRIYGSPDITDDKDITVALPRKRPISMTMHRVEIKTKDQPAAE